MFTQIAHSCPARVSDTMDIIHTVCMYEATHIRVLIHAQVPNKMNSVQIIRALTWSKTVPKASNPSSLRWGHLYAQSRGRVSVKHMCIKTNPFTTNQFDFEYKVVNWLF